jgi:hypothetical protein
MPSRDVESGRIRSASRSILVFFQGSSEWPCGLVLCALLRIKSLTSKQTKNKRQLPTMMDFVLHDVPYHIYQRICLSPPRLYFFFKIFIRKAYQEPVCLFMNTCQQCCYRPNCRV